jgi:hypothetical protein
MGNGGKATRRALEDPAGGRPEPHPLDFDWRFTAETQGRLQELLHNRSSVLLLGTPSLRDQADTRVLVDRHPLATSNSSHIAIDLRRSAPSIASRRFSAVVLDPPWYPADLEAWLAFAFGRVERRSIVAFTLWPEATRPDAAAERARTLRAVAPFGGVKLLPGFVRYMTPRFEAEAMRAEGRFPLPAWRMGDLVVVTIEKRTRFESTVHFPQPPRRLWQRYVLGRQQIAVRVADESRTVPLLGRVPGLATWTLGSVSRRHPCRDHVQLWTSRNWVARLENASAFVRALDGWVSGRRSAELDGEAQIALGLLAEHGVLGDQIGGVSWTHLE